jgi:predicted GNAT family N-acyltransferase
MMQFMRAIEILPWNKASARAYPIRSQVFINEQGVPKDLELDEDDPLAWHALATRDDQAIGTARLLSSGKIGRLAVLPNHRKQGVGKELMLALLDFGQQQGIRQFYLHAQVSAVDFYARLGFQAIGPIFNEAGIEHIKMVKSN